MKKIAIIGAGPSGLSTAKSCLEENNLIPTVFEKFDQLGGVWNLKNGIAWPGMHFNVSRHTGEFSDFSYPENTEDFPTKETVNNYLERYADHYNLRPYIKFGREIIFIDYNDSKWLVRWKENQQVFEEYYDGVVIAMGKYNKPFVPPFTGLDNFQGKKLHSAHYRNPAIFADENVLVVGGSLSGTSIAEEISKSAKTVYHVFRQPRWILPRYLCPDPQQTGPYLPRDLLLKTRINAQNYSKELQYQRMQSICYKQNLISDLRVDQDSNNDFVVADDYLQAVEEHKIIPIRSEIDQCAMSQITLKNGQQLPIDSIIFCTGFEYDFSIFAEQLKLNPHTLSLYAEIFSHLPGLAFVGFYHGRHGAVFPNLELQARLACAVYSGRYQLPQEEVLKTSTSTSQSEKECHEIEFADKLAKDIGVLPDLSELKNTNQRLFKALWEGSSIPAQYRLNKNDTISNIAVKKIEQTDQYRSDLLSWKTNIVCSPNLGRKYLNNNFFAKQNKSDNQTNPSTIKKDPTPF